MATSHVDVPPMPRKKQLPPPPSREVRLRKQLPQWFERYGEANDVQIVARFTNVSQLLGEAATRFLKSITAWSSTSVEKSMTAMHAGGVRFDEYIVYDPDQAVPVFLSPGE